MIMTVFTENIKHLTPGRKEINIQKSRGHNVVLRRKTNFQFLLSFFSYMVICFTCVQPFGEQF